jgi:hypothetical protein
MCINICALFAQDYCDIYFDGEPTAGRYILTEQKVVGYLTYVTGEAQAQGQAMEAGQPPPPGAKISTNRLESVLRGMADLHCSQLISKETTYRDGAKLRTDPLVRVFSLFIKKHISEERRQ